MPDPSGLVDLPAEKKVVEVHQILCAEYGCPVAYFHGLDPLSELISALLSHRTLNRTSAAAFHALRDKYPSWEAVRDADTSEIEQVIYGVTWPEQKAPRIQEVLRRITEFRGALELDFLTELSVEEARAWLEQLPGVGPKTSAAVMSFSEWRRRALPVDSHHYRVALRLGLVPPTVDVGSSHRILEAQLPEAWDAQAVYDNHQVLMRHGKRCCYPRNPDCPRCVVSAYCPYGQTRLALQPRVDA